MPKATPDGDLTGPVMRVRFARLRRALWVHVFALFAMCVQVLFYADHIGAAAAAEIGRAPIGARLGLLQICTGEGIVLMTPDGRTVPNAPAQPSHDSGQCSVCTSASVCGFDAPAAMAMPIFQAQLIAPARVVLPVLAPRILHIRSLRPIRAPPIL
ncbi:hypothetical protein [Thioclava sp.]|uniref:hypothetical protein n=1 Tax=Thioclava sp. TaxID=1933450 RepID=UPI003AA7BB02